MNSKVKFLIATIILPLTVVAGDPNFSIRNKSDQDIIIQLNNCGLEIPLEVTVPKGTFYNNQISISIRTHLRIIDATTNEYKMDVLFLGKNKKIYINWNGRKVYAQKGSSKGIKGKNHQGFCFENNVENTPTRGICYIHRKAGYFHK